LEVGGLRCKASPGKSARPHLKNKPKAKWTKGMAQKTLRSNLRTDPSPQKKSTPENIMFICKSKQTKRAFFRGVIDTLQ
jgi:hypothetical protein